MKRALVMNKTKENIYSESKVLKKEHLEKNLFYLSLCLFLIYVVLLINTAWIGDDAYITFRTIDNFVNGYGLRWNIVERVQSYTHPLWLFLLSAFYFFTKEIFFTSLIISITLSLASVLILVFKLAVAKGNMVLVLFSVIFSKAFIDYSTSGLENPLTYLLLVLFACIYFSNKTAKTKIIFLSVLSSLVLINRMDTFLLLLPAYSYYILKNKYYKNYYLIIIGFSPFIFWELFSLVYYGFLFPNTAYAKLNTGIDKSDLIIQGFRYFYSSFKLDPVTLIVLFLLTFLSTLKDNRKFFPFTIGIFFYLLYIIWIGGDFMSGRFFSAPFLVAVIILSKIKFNKSIESISFILIIVLIEVFSQKSYHLTKNTEINLNGICDERLYYYPNTGLILNLTNKSYPNSWVYDGQNLKIMGTKFSKATGVGFMGFYSGPDCHILDLLALNDPLLARLPSLNSWRVGHYKRELPDGYEETLKTGHNQIKNTNLAKYYDKIFLITRGDLWDWNRIREIWKINTGQYSYLLKDYFKQK